MRQEWNIPSRADHYAMQTAQVVAQSHAKRPSSVLLGLFKIPFSFRRVKDGDSKEPVGRRKTPTATGSVGGRTGEAEMSVDQETQWSMGKWLRAVGMRVRRHSRGE